MQKQSILKEVWPNFFIVGAPKAGTTSLFEYVKEIPGIYMSPKKEPYYFCRKMIPDYHYVPPIRDKQKYLSLFSNVTNEKIVGEASVWYLSDPDSAKLIHKVSPDAHILICLRDPVERTFSHYLFLQHFLEPTLHEQLKKELKKGVDYSTPHIRINAGLYYESVKRYLELFGKDKVKVIIFEEFIRDTQGTVNEILKFLGLEETELKINSKAYNVYSRRVPRGKISQKILQRKMAKKIVRSFIPSSGRRFIENKILKKKTTNKPNMTEQDREFLINYFKEDVKKIQILLNKKLPWKNFSHL